MLKQEVKRLVNKHSPTCGICYCGMYYVLFLSYSYCNLFSQEDFTGKMTNLYSFIQGSLEWLFSELLFSVVLLWNQCKYITFNILSCRILIISYKMLIITEISIETRNEFTKSAILCQKVTIFHRQELASLFQVQEKFKVCRNSKCNFSTGSSFYRTWYFEFLRQCPFVKILSNESTSKLLWNFCKKSFEISFCPR